MMMFAIIFGLPVVAVIWLAILAKWQRGITWLVLYLPFASGIALALRPSPIGTLFKDFLFVLPVYAIFFLIHTRELSRVRIPQTMTFILVLFGALVLLQLFNPSLGSMVVGAVGVKVWLLYIPLAYLVSVMIEEPDDLVRLLRLSVAVAIIPCGVGILQFLLCTAIGYEVAMTMFYGSKAFDVTQGFTSFVMGAEFFRIPSTFSFVTQYSGYALMMIPITYMHMSIESHPGWRSFARIMMGVVFVACMLSGARANFLFAPLLFLTILFLDAKLTRLALGLVFGPFVMMTTLEAVGIDPLRTFGATGQLAQSYGTDLIFPELIASIAENPLGSGTGVNTGAALNIMSAVQKARVHNIEGYYSKAVIELGFPGLMLVILIFGALIAYGLRIRGTLRDPLARSCAAAIAGFLIIMALHSFKGWQIDLDPINVWYWIMVGILFRLPYLQFTEIAERRRAADEMRHKRRGRPRRGRLAPRPGAVRPGIRA